MKTEKKLKLVEEKETKEPRPWTHGADVMATFRRHGWVPPTEYRSDWLFAINRTQG